MSRCLVAGCGYVGTALAQRLCDAGHNVWTLRRNADLLPAETNQIAADLTHPQDLAQLPEQLDVVFYTAAADDSSESAYRAAYIDGLRILTQHLAKHGLRPRVLFTSSTAVYGQHDGQCVDEMSETAPSRSNGRLLLEAEAVLSKSGLPHTVLRLGGIYGPGRDSLLRSVREGQATYSEGAFYTNRIHRDDCAGALLHLAMLPSVEHLYLGVDNEPAERRVVLEYLAKLIAAPAPQLSATAVSRAGSKRCSNERLRNSGYRFYFPSFREGYREMLDTL